MYCTINIYIFKQCARTSRLKFAGIVFFTVNGMEDWGKICHDSVFCFIKSKLAFVMLLYNKHDMFILTARVSVKTVTMAPE